MKEVLSTLCWVQFWLLAWTLFEVADPKIQFTDRPIIPRFEELFPGPGTKP